MGANLGRSAPREGMTTHHSDEDAVGAFVAQLIETSFTLMTIVDEMTRFAASGRSAPDAPPVPEVLRDLLRGVLAPLVATHSRAAVEQATAVLGSASDIVCEDIYTVSFDSPPARRASAQRRRRRPH